MTSYPKLQDVLAVHARLIERLGGSLGIRDRGALESALARPQTGYYIDLIQEAAALWESLSQNNPFIDGNKRVAVTVCAAFLRMNGYRLDFDDRVAYAFLISLYEENQFSFSELETWPRTLSIPLRTQHSRYLPGLQKNLSPQRLPSRHIWF